MRDRGGLIIPRITRRGWTEFWGDLGLNVQTIAWGALSLAPSAWRAWTDGFKAVTGDWLSLLAPVGVFGLVVAIYIFSVAPIRMLREAEAKLRQQTSWQAALEKELGRLIVSGKKLRNRICDDPSGDSRAAEAAEEAWSCEYRDALRIARLDSQIALIDFSPIGSRQALFNGNQQVVPESLASVAMSIDEKLIKLSHLLEKVHYVGPPDDPSGFLRLTSRRITSSKESG